MKLALIAGLALAASLMEEAEAGTSSGGVAGIEGKVVDGDPAPTLAGIDRAPDLADISGDTEHQPPGAHLDAPAAKAAEAEAGTSAPVEEGEDELANACAAGSPKVALVGKYSDRVPVQLKSRAHLERLISEHGVGSVEVLP